MKRMVMVWMIFLGLFHGVTARPAQAGAASVTVVGIDRSDGVKMTLPALRMAEEQAWRAEAGATVIFRWISDRSYAPDQVIAMLALPATPQLPLVRGPFDRRGRAARERARALFSRRVHAEKERTVRALRAVSCTGPTNSTDIVGFFQAAEERFDEYGSEVSRRIVVYTDLQDNRHFRVRPRLEGVEIDVYMMRVDPDPARSRKLRQRWQGLFQGWGAGPVIFRRPLLRPEWRADIRECR